MIRSLLVLALLFVSATAQAFPLTLTYEANDLKGIVQGEVSDGVFHNVSVLAPRPDGSIARGGDCVGPDGDRCFGALSEVLNYIHPDDGPAGVVFEGGGVRLTCHRADAGDLTGLVVDCSTVGISGLGEDCDGPTGTVLGACVGSAAGSDELLWERLTWEGDGILSGWEILGTLRHLLVWFAWYEPMPLAG